MPLNSHITQLKVMSFSITTVENKWGETPTKQLIINHKQAKILQSILSPFPSSLPFEHQVPSQNLPNTQTDAEKENEMPFEQGQRPLKVFTKIVLHLLCDSSQPNIFLPFRALDCGRQSLIFLLCWREKNESTESERPGCSLSSTLDNHLIALSLSFYICKVDILFASHSCYVFKDSVRVLTHCLTDEVLNKWYWWNPLFPCFSFSCGWIPMKGT